MKKIKICIICSVQFTYEKFLNNFAKKLASKNYEVHAAFSFTDHTALEKENGIFFHNIPIKRKANILEIVDIVIY